MSQCEVSLGQTDVGKKGEFQEERATNTEHEAGESTLNKDFQKQEERQKAEVGIQAKAIFGTPSQ